MSHELAGGFFTTELPGKPTLIYIYIYTYICAQTHPLLYRCVFVHVKKQTPLKDHYYLVKELDFAAEDSPLVLAQSCKA